MPSNNALVGSIMGNLPSMANTVESTPSDGTNVFGTFAPLDLRTTVVIGNAGGVTVLTDGKIRSARLRVRFGVTADTTDMNGNSVTVGLSGTMDLALNAGQTEEEGKFSSLEAAKRFRTLVGGLTDGELATMINGSYNVMHDFANPAKQVALTTAIVPPLLVSAAG